MSLMHDQEGYVEKYKFHTAMSQEFSDSPSGEPSTVRLTVIGARDLPAMNTNNTADSFFTVTYDNHLIYQSEISHDTSDPEWNAKMTIPVTDKYYCIRIQIFDDETNPELIGTVDLELESLTDQNLHSQWCDIVGQEGISNGELNIIAQWTHKSSNIHTESAEVYGSIIEKTKEQIEETERKIEVMLKGDIHEALEVWFAGQDPDAEAEIRNSKFLSFAATKLTSLLTSPKGFQSGSPGFNFGNLIYSEANSEYLKNEPAMSLFPASTKFLTIGFYSHRQKAGM
jgi:hypothetical protein